LKSDAARISRYLGIDGADDLKTLLNLPADHFEILGLSGRSCRNSVGM
jgi:hypothetical protein